MIEDSPVFPGLSIAFCELAAKDDVVVVGTARSGEEGLRLARDLRPDAVTVDLMLPSMPGLELLLELRRLLPAATLVVVTSHDEESYRSASLAASADVFVPKSELNHRLVPALMRDGTDPLGQPSNRPAGNQVPS